MLPAPVGAISGQSVRGAALHTDPFPDSGSAGQSREHEHEWGTEDLAVGQLHCLGDLKPGHFCEPECFICQWIIGFQQKENVLSSNVKQVQ